MVSFSAPGLRASYAVGRDGVGLRHDLLLLDHVLEDEHDLVGRRAVQVGAAAVLGDFSAALVASGVTGAKLVGMMTPRPAWRACSVSMLDEEVRPINSFG